jgi:ParB-like chromosome segregation protein Spo0J
VPLARLQPATVNNAIYKPVRRTDPEVVHLANLVREQGLLEPIVATLDDVILSGHRRRVACQLAGLAVVPVRRHPIRSDDPEFERLLVSFNAQRVKSADQQLREAVVLTNRKDAYAALIEHREVLAEKARSRAAIAALEVVPSPAARRRSDISAAKRPMLDAVIAVLEANRTYWPLTVRQVHYRLLNDPPLRNAAKPDSRYANTKQSYQDLSDLLTRARVTGAVPWHAIHDPTRPQVSWLGWPSAAPYIRDQLDEFLGGYRRDLLQSQPAYVEIVGEKMTLQTVIERAARRYMVPLSIGRGYSSIDARHQLAQRFRASGKARAVLLFVSDFDPEGENIPENYAASMRDEFGIDALSAHKIALTPEQVQFYRLPPAMTAKQTSSRAAGFVGRHGEAVYEAEALSPATLEQLVRSAIERVLDMDLFRREQEREADDAATLSAARRQAVAALAGVIGGGRGKPR